MKIGTNYRIILVLFLVSLIALPASGFARQEISRGTTLGLNSPEKMKPSGEYVIEVLKGDNWQVAGRLSFDRYYREREIDLARFIDGSEPLKIRLTEKGGGAAHIDSISLGGMPPVGAQFIAPSGADVVGAGAVRELSLRKISKKDFDVIDALGKTFEFTFDVTINEDNAGAIHELPLRLTARVEPVVISKTPFQFPIQNLFRPMNEHSRFYHYRLDGMKGERANNQDPFFKEYSRTGSGHPSGFTYGWVRNDRDNLYVAMDFTADNTMDGDKDYAKVYVKTEGGVKEFRVSEKETAWGKPSFTYTDKVAYQHKVYEFKIPLKELDMDVRTQFIAPSDGVISQALSGKKTFDIQLAFAAYGTATPAAGDYEPAIAYDPGNNRFLAVFERFDSTQYDVVGQLLNPDGSPFGTEIVIASTADNQRYPEVAFGGGVFLVTWDDLRNGVDADIYGQIIGADGTPSGGNFAVSDSSVEYKTLSKVAYDSVNNRFMVVWGDWRDRYTTHFDIYGQLVSMAGQLLLRGGGTGSDNFPISQGNNSQQAPAISYDTVNQQYLVVWHDWRIDGVTTDIYGQRVAAGDGSMLGSNFVISNRSSG